MKALKVIGATLLAVIVLMLVISFFLPAKVHVERSAVIKASPDIVFDQVNTLKNWENWSPWHKIDPEMKLTYSDIPSGKGAFYDWKSTNDNVGNGKLTILDSHPYEYIGVEMDFMENGKAKGAYTFVKEEAGDTKVTWSMDSDMGMNPIGRYIGLLMDRMVGPDFEKGLNNLKGVCEKAYAPQVSAAAAASDSTAAQAR